MKGTVKALGKRDWNGKTLYSIKVDDEWYGTGTDNPKLDRGDLIEFNYTENGKYKNADVKTISVLRKGTEVFKASTKNVAFGGKDDYWKKREERDVITQQVIQLQSSRNSAIALADVLLKNGAVKLPEAQAKKMDVVVALVKELTGNFEAESLAHRGMAEVADDPEPEAEPATTGEEIWNG